MGISLLLESDLFHLYPLSVRYTPINYRARTINYIVSHYVKILHVRLLGGGGGGVQIICNH